MRDFEIFYIAKSEFIREVLLELSTIVTLEKYQLFCSDQIISQSLIEWLQDMDHDESILRMSRDPVESCVGREARRDEELLCSWIIDLISLDPLVFIKILEFSHSLLSHSDFHLTRLRRCSVLVMLIGGSDEVSMLSADSDIRRDPIICELIPSEVCWRRIKKLASVNLDSSELIDRRFPFSELLIREEDHGRLVFCSEIQSSPREFISILESRWDEDDMLELSK